MSSIIASLQKKGFRISPTRSAIVSIFEQANKPLTAVEMLKLLNTLGLRVNKTTVYREIDFLVKNGVLNELTLNPRIAHYESTKHKHHHHLVCERCNYIEKIAPLEVEKHIIRLVKRVKRSEGFIVKKHSLEFIGHCSRCS